MKEHRRQVQKWESSSNVQLLGNLLDPMFHLPPNVRITQCVCLGLGRLSPKDEEQQHIEQSKVVMEQMVFLTVVLDTLRRAHPMPDVIFQDPAFTEVEIGFLEGLGHTVLQDPKAYERLKSTAATFVYAPFPFNFVVADVFKTCQPTLFLGPILSAVRDEDKDILAVEVLRGDQNLGEGKLRILEEGRLRRFEKFRELKDYEEMAHMRGMPAFDMRLWYKALRLYWL